MQPFEKVERSKKQIILNNFLGGIAWGVGATLGLAIFFAILGLVLSKFDWIPFIGQFITKINLYISQSGPHLIK